MEAQTSKSIQCKIIVMKVYFMFKKKITLYEK